MRLLFFCVALLVIGGNTKSIGVHSNWPRVEENLDRLHELVYYTLFSIYTSAVEDNPAVGEAIGPKVNDVADAGLNLLAIVDADVENKNLTVEIARLHLGSLLVLFTDLYSSISSDLDDLTEPARTKIDSDFALLYLQIPRIANEIYAALDEEAPLVCGILGVHNNETVEPPELIPFDLPPGTEIWRERIYAVDYASIPLLPHNKYLDVELSSEFLWFKTTNDFPNFIDDTNATAIRRIIQFYCVDGSNVIYEFNFPLVELEEPIIEPTQPSTTSTTTVDPTTVDPTTVDPTTVDPTTEDST